MAITFVQATHNQEAFSTAQGMALKFASPVGAGHTLVTVAIGRKNPNPYPAGTSTTAGTQAMDSNSPNPVVSDGTTALSFTLTAAAAPAAALVLTSVDTASGGNSVYHGTITGGAANALAGQTFLVAGFTTSANNGTFLCTASSATLLTLANAAGAAETHAGTAQTQDSVYTGTITGGGSNAFAGRTFVITGFATSANNGTFACVQSSTTTLTLANASAVNETHAGNAASGGSNSWTTTVTAKSLYALTTTGTLFTDESDSDLAADYPAIYISRKFAGVLAGESINLNSAYIGSQIPGTQDSNGAAGVSIFNGGVNAVALEFAGVVTGTASGQSQVTTANPARSGGSNIGVSGDVQIAVGYMKDGNTFAASSGWTVAYSDKVIGSQTHFVVAYRILTAATRASFDNPLGYQMAVATLNIAV